MSTGKIVSSLSALAAVSYAIYHFFPDFRRYLRIRSL